MKIIAVNEMLVPLPRGIPTLEEAAKTVRLIRKMRDFQRAGQNFAVVQDGDIWDVVRHP